MLVGHYIKEEALTCITMMNKQAIYPRKKLDYACVYLLAHNPEVTYGEQLDTVPRLDIMVNTM